MDRYKPSAAESQGKNDEYGVYKAVPLQEDGGFSRNRKRGTKTATNVDDTRFVDSYEPAVEPRQADGHKREKQGPRCCRNTKYYLCEFCDNTSIHGLKFLGERGRYVIEKLWWALVVLSAVTGSGCLIYKAYGKWVTSPIVVTFAMTETPIWQIPFPAVTICPEVKSNSSIFNYTDVYLKYLREEEVHDEEDKYFDLFSLVCDDIFEYGNESKVISEYLMLEFLNSFAPLDAAKCKWSGNPYECLDILSYTLTSEGWCRTFNMLDYEEVFVDPEQYLENRSVKNTRAERWSLENGYPSDAGLDTYPRRSMLSGSKAGFQLDLLVRHDELDYFCADLQGFKVALHHPAEVPDMDDHFRVPLDQAVIVSIEPRMITTSEEIRAYSPIDRQCYLPGEKKLAYYVHYSQRNCLSECLTNFTLKVCGCASFYMSFESGTEICGAGSRQCIEEAKVTFLSSEVDFKINKTTGRVAEHCDCLPACTSIYFDSETSQTDFEWRKTYKQKGYDPEIEFSFEKDHVSRVMVYYKNMQFMTSERHEVYGYVDFLANCGGLLGLFCGFSCTSSMEIIYYLTLRLVCNVKKFGRSVWSGAPELTAT